MARRAELPFNPTVTAPAISVHVFNDLLFRRRECLFFAFDLLFLNGEDLRWLPLIERKARLKKLLRVLHWQS
ncbi:MAG: hypothetical protein AUH28_15070 [Acidobacteria bacterium 13_1_40CM_56_16]|nr:MAG: hypothetical protein AUH28_15070 [Acidobacteria bacterium 13_1_40CM_56_16]